MNWIKAHPAQTTLALLSLGLVGATSALFLQYSHFRNAFSLGDTFRIEKDDVPSLELEQLDSAIQSAANPRQKLAHVEGPRLFASKPYVLKHGRLKRTAGEVFHPPVPNDWLTGHGLELVAANVLSADPDGDGFSTLAEWHGVDGIPHSSEKSQPAPKASTNPVDAKSHPPHHTRLALHRIEFIPFRLKFMSADVDPRKPQEATFQINTIDGTGTSHYVRLGQPIPATQFTVLSYEEKHVPGADGTKKDVSELTVLNRKTGEKVVLPKEVVVDSPKSYAVIHYLWPMRSDAKPAELRKKKGERFNLPPQIDVTYEVARILPDEVEVRLSSGESHRVRKMAQ